MKYSKIYRRLRLLLGCFALGLFLSGCHPSSSQESQASPETNAEKKTVCVTTSFLQDMVTQLAGDRVQVELIIPAGEDPHLYQATPSDMQKLQKADLVLYHGLHFEGKMSAALEKIGHPVTVNFAEQEVGTMEEDQQKVVDPHFWFDIALYKKAVEEAEKQLETLLPEEKGEFEANLASYLKDLDALDAKVKEGIQSIPENQRYLVTPHDAFNYFSRAYGIEVVAPQGVSTDAEVSNADIEKTASFIVEHQIKAIFTESTTNADRMKKLEEVCRAKGHALTVVHGENQELFSDSLAPKGQPGDTYITMYEHNLQLIVDHLK